jgi:hypothetical protein
VRTSDAENGQPIGLDIGTSRIVVARLNDKQYEYAVQLNAFIVLPYSKLTESLMVQANVFHEVRGQEIIVAGSDAERFAEVFHVETRRPMFKGLLNPSEPHSLSVVQRIIARLAGRAATEGQKAYFSVPAPSEDGEGILVYHGESIRQILLGLGYDARPITEGLAVVFGELSSSSYTGIGISCGSGLCNICLAVLSLPVISFSLSKAGDFIDSQAALATGEVANRLRIQKEQSFRFNGFSSDLVHNALSVYHDEVIRNLVEGLCTRIASVRNLPKFDQSLRVVLSGGTAMPKGFLEHFERALRSSSFQVPISDVWVAADPLFSTAKGALIAALH